MATLALKKKPQPAAPAQKVKGPASTPPRFIDRPALFAAMQAWHPELFNDSDPQPLALGIHRPLRAEPSPLPIQMKRALDLWVSRDDYLRAVIARRPRIGLDGSTSPVLDQHAAYAAERLAAHEAKA